MIKNEKILKKILYVVRLEPTISTLTAIRSIQMAKWDGDGYRIRKSEDLKSILFIMFANLKLVFRSYTSLYGIFMSASLTLYFYTLLLASNQLPKDLILSTLHPTDNFELVPNFYLGPLNAKKFPINKPVGYAKMHSCHGNP